MAKRALICGISGQDGSYLARLLLGNGYEVWGGSRDAELSEFRNLRQLGLLEAVSLQSLNLRDIGSIISLLRKFKPDEVYSLAGQSSVGLSFEQPVESFESIALGTLNLLEAIRISGQGIRFYNAGSTECFGDTGDAAATEQSQFHPRSPYAVAKASAYWTVVNYREAYDMFACTGILSNHDSPLRPLRFVTRKIIHSVALVAMGRDTKLHLGNMDIERDWGWAPEYVEAIAMMLQQPKAQDYIIATGESHSLVDFVQAAFELIGRDWREFVTISEVLKRPTDIRRSRVDPSLAHRLLGWKAKVNMKQVIKAMFESELASLQSDG